VVPETTALQTLTGEAAPVDVEAPAEQPLDPPGAVTFTGVALPNYQNVADFVVRMNNLEHLSNAQLNSAELDRETFVEPAIEFEVASELLTVSGERGTEVRIEGGDRAEAASNPVDGEATGDEVLEEVANAGLGGGRTVRCRGGAPPMSSRNVILLGVLGLVVLVVAFYLLLLGPLLENLGQQADARDQRQATLASSEPRWRGSRRCGAARPSSSASCLS
jgi:hypothetical protein